jgi:lipopolysaccharide/colanic/teichoic acid biosynthesis glycosyltransferase
VDELPQLWTVLSGEMSAVGPRAAWVEEETAIVDGARQWRKRWFVKPGLTGLAQVNGVDSTDPEAKLRYDVAYIRRQSPWLDLRIVARQMGQVVWDAKELLWETGRR